MSEGGPMGGRGMSGRDAVRLLARGFLCGAVFTAMMLGLAPARAASAPPGCGVEVACTVATGEYRIRMPDGWDGRRRVGAIVFLHGYRGTALNEINNTALSATISQLGLAFVAPQGAGRSWSFPGSPQRRRDDIAFMNAVLDDIVARHSVDPERIMASGFSVGGSMVWYLACYMGERFAGFAPVAGAFWEPQPTDCPGPQPNLFHVHGTADRTVPMAGRPIGNRAHQGDVGEGFALWTAKGACSNETPERFDADTLKLACQRRTNCAGKVIELCLHPGGHSFRTAWLKRAWLELADKNGWDVPAGAR